LRKGWKGDDEKDRCKKDGKIKKISGRGMAGNCTERLE